MLISKLKNQNGKRLKKFLKFDKYIEENKDLLNKLF